MMDKLESRHFEASAVMDEEYNFARYAEAFKVFIELTQQGYYQVYNEMGIFYEFGYGVEKDLKCARDCYISYLKKEKDSTMVIGNLAGLYYKQMNNYRQAVYWWKQGIALGDGDCALEYAKALLQQKRPNKKKIKELLMFASQIEEMFLSEDSREEVELLLKQTKF